MNYELAIELKDKGFPQSKGVWLTDIVGQLGSCRVPTLSELIEACGREFALTSKHNEDRWEAHSWGDRWGTGPRPRGEGSTPEEATARLWLALHS